MPRASAEIRPDRNSLDAAKSWWSAHPVLIGAAAIAALTLVAYLPVLHAGFIWDDDQYITRNRLLEDPEGWWKLWVPGTTPQYYPAVFTMFWVEFALWGLNPLGYHLVNVVLHAANAVLVWRLARRLGIPGAWLIAAVFAVHPVHVESVAWITERKNTLSGFFYLCAALQYLRFDRAIFQDRVTGEASKAAWQAYAFSVLLFALALLAKTVTCSLPAAMVLMLLWQRQELSVRRLLPLAPMFALGLALALHTAAYERHFVGAQGEHFAFTFADRALIASNALLFYPWKLLWPWPVMFMYPRWTIDPHQLLSYWPLAAMLLVGAGAVAFYRRGTRGPLLALLYFAGTAFPALGFVNVYPFVFSFVADHFQYLASLGMLSLVVGGLVWLTPRKQVVSVGGAIALAALVTLSWRQARTYESAETVYRDTLAKNDASWMPHNNLSSILLRQGVELFDHGDSAAAGARLAEGEHHARRSIELHPDHPQALNNLSEILRLQGRYDEALPPIQRYVELLESRPDDPALGTQGQEIRNSHLGEAYWKLGRLQELLKQYPQALASYRKAFELQPQDPTIQREFYRSLRFIGGK